MAAAAEEVAVVAGWAAAHFYLPPVTLEEPWSAVSAVTEPQSAAWAAVPGTALTLSRTKSKDFFNPRQPTITTLLLLLRLGLSLSTVYLFRAGYTVDR